VTDIDELLVAVGQYRLARQALLDALGCSGSNRDPFAEFSEHLVCALVDGKLAASRVQKGWDLTDADGARVQVRYLANPANGWVNEHLVEFRGDCDRYALVVIEAFDPVAVLIFRQDTLTEVCQRLGKRHGRQDETLHLTRRNYIELLERPDSFHDLVVVYDLKAFTSSWRASRSEHGAR
jgi:hypothetical protein